MRKRYKILLGISIFILISIAGGYYWLINGWKKYIPEEELSAYATQIKKYPPLPNEFKELYYKLHPKQKEATLTGELTERVYNLIFKNYSGHAKQNCSCDDIFHYDWTFTSRLKGPYDPLKPTKLGYGLQKFLSNEECLNYSIRLQYEELKDIRAGYSFESKNIDELNKHDIIDYFIAEKGSYYYSPQRSPERYNIRKKVIEEQINKNDL